MGDKIIAVTQDKCFMNFGTEMEMQKNSIAIHCMRHKASPNHSSVNNEGAFPRHLELKIASVPTAASGKEIAMCHP